MRRAGNEGASISISAALEDSTFLKRCPTIISTHQTEQSVQFADVNKRSGINALPALTVQ